MRIGDDAFDRDHRQLIAMINLLADALQLGDLAQAVALAGDLRTKAGQDASFNSAAHRQLADLAGAVRLVVEAGEVELASRLVVMLEEKLAAVVNADRRVAITLHPTSAWSEQAGDHPQ